MAKVKDVSELSDRDKETAAELKRGKGPMKRGIATLRAMLARGGSCTHDDIAKITNRTKGNELRALRIAGFVSADDTHDAPVYTVTREGREFLKRHAQE